MPEGRTYQARRDDPVTGREQVVYITNAADIGRARAALRRHGWDSAKELAAVPPGFDLPGDLSEDAVVIEAPPPMRPAAVADSLLFNRLTWQIAIGVCLGMILFAVLSWVVAVVLAAIVAAAG